ncbi:uncharacterized protein LOC122954963 [Acropora millepora]|uniref:uncharacterized protein LOC122954963 n=2 Tax=Acropora millepora TaxID=45264 RepID=UPI001CF262AC|nr:uncharacterized protein LOC122954963 [Acropora millepora]
MTARTSMMLACLVLMVDSCPTSKPDPTDMSPAQTFHPYSCLDYLKRGVSKCDVYKLFDSNGNSFPAYCDFQSERGTAWTLVMSWSHAHRALAPFRSASFNVNSPVNENAFNWKMYRLSLARVRSLQSHSTHWRATCSYPIHGVDFRDYVRGNFKDFNIVDFVGAGQCKKVEFINIRGHNGMHRTARFWQKTGLEGLHIDSASRGCQFNPSSGSVHSEDNFGYYKYTNPKFRCSKDDQSTTQWWFGAHL